jgi:predicted phage tail protein
MMRKIYLEGSLGDQFTSEIEAEVSSVQEALKLIDANFPLFKGYLVDCHEKNIGFTVEIAGQVLEKEEDLIFPLSKGDIIISPIPAGSKSGGAKILAAIFIVVLTAGIGAVIQAGGMAAAAGWGLAAIPMGLSAAMGSAWGLAGLMLGLNLAIAGIQQLMAPDPSVDENAPQSYMFNGSEQNIVEGDPVPLLYGELKVPGRPIAFSVVNNSRVYSAYSYAGVTDSGTTVTSPGREGLYTQSED